MLDQLTQATFAPLVGRRFRLHVNAASTVEVELIETLPLPVRPGRGGQAPKRVPFSLVFRGPRQFVLPQRIYPVEQAALGTAGMFLVPIGPDDVGQRYEAIFN
jgi:hypothetical protein